MLQRAVKRSYSALRTPSNIETWDEHTLNRWLTARENKLVLVNVVPSISRLENLLRVLPTRRENDFGTHEILSQVSPKPGDFIHPGHHLVRQPLSPHARLRPDGSPTIQAPPVPWTRRHWAGGTLQFAPQPLLAGLGFVRGKVEVTKEAIQPDITMPEEDEPFHSESPQYDGPEYVAHEWLPIVKIVQRFITAQWYPQYLPLILEVRNTEFHTKGFDRSNVKVCK